MEEGSLVCLLTISYLGFILYNYTLVAAVFPTGGAAGRSGTSLKHLSCILSEMTTYQVRLRFKVEENVERQILCKILVEVSD